MLNALVAQSDWAILVLRLVLGLIFIAHGFRKLKNFSGTVSWLGGEGFKPGWLWAPIVTATELGGGILILLGLFLQPVALLVTINMMVAFLYNIKKKKPFIGSLELDLILIASLLLLSTLGNGFFALGSSLGF